MKRVFTLLLCVVVTVVSFAYDFTGKTFRASATIDGTKFTMTYNFKANHRLTGTLAISGQKPTTDSGMHWEISGDFINLYDSTGDYSYLEIGVEDGKTVLIMQDDYGNARMVFREVAATASKKSTSKKKK